MLHSDCEGNDLDDLQNIRYYLLSSLEHSVCGSPANSPGICRQPRNTLDASPVLRALFIALDEWVTGTEPPPSMVPSVNAGTAVFVQSTEYSCLGIGTVSPTALGWPAIPNIAYTGVATVRNEMDFGLQSVMGVITVIPPRPTGNLYPCFVPKVDADGNEIAGIRLPLVAVPVATYTGWSVRADQFGGPDGGENFGQEIPFVANRVERESTSDPRQSLQERYGNREAYVLAVTYTAQALVKRRLLLPEDAQAYVEEAKTRPLSF